MYPKLLNGYPMNSIYVCWVTPSHHRLAPDLGKTHRRFATWAASKIWLFPQVQYSLPLSCNYFTPSYETHLSQGSNGLVNSWSVLRHGKSRENSQQPQQPVGEGIPGLHAGSQTINHLTGEPKEQKWHHGAFAKWHDYWETDLISSNGREIKTIDQSAR